MQIRHQQQRSRTMHDRECMEQGYEAVFDDDGIARVRQEVGECLAEKYDAIETADDADDEAGAEPDEPPDAGAESADSDEDVAEPDEEPTDETSDTNGSDNN